MNLDGVMRVYEFTCDSFVCVCVCKFTMVDKEVQYLQWNKAVIYAGEHKGVET